MSPQTRETRYGATSCWEKFDPEWPAPHEQKDLSYCHGWSAGPGQMLPAYVAGAAYAVDGKPVEATEENRMTCFALKGGRTYALSLVSAGSKQ